MKQSLLLIPFFVAGCSSYKFKGTNLKWNVVSYMDPVNKTIIYDYEYENGILEYKRLIKNHRINSNPNWSCFRSSKSVNYLDITVREVKYFRSLHVDTIKTISYEKEDIKADTKYIRRYREISLDSLKVESKRCLIKSKEETFYVTSEIYSQ